jgi:chemotaxis protein histidine kinase CheA
MLIETSANLATMNGLRAIAHGLAGAGSLYGLPSISEAAADLEDVVLAARDGADGAPISIALNRLLAEINDARAHA